MSSLSIDAGALNPKNFHVESASIEAVTRRDYKNGNLYATAAVGNQYTGQVAELANGRVLDNFHRRKNSGELLPYTNYQYITHSEVSGAVGMRTAGYKAGTAPFDTFLHTWSHNGGSAENFLGHINVKFGKGTLAQTLLSEQGIDPYHLVSQAAAKLYGRGWDGLTFLAEFKQLVRLFRSALENFMNLTGSLVQLLQNHPGQEHLLSQVPSTWLELRYGWRILGYDIEDIEALLFRVDKEQRTRNKEKVGFERIVNTNATTVVGSDHRLTYTDLTEWNIGVRGSIISDFIPADIIMNPVLTLWEKIPYSFVFDWFIHVGQAISALSFVVLNDQYTASTGVVVSCDRSVNCDVTFHGTWAAGTLQHSSWGDISYSETWTYKKRNPVFVSFTPYYNLNLSDLKVIDLLALLVQQVDKFTRR